MTSLIPTTTPKSLPIGNPLANFLSRYFARSKASSLKTSTKALTACCPQYFLKNIALPINSLSSVVQCRREIFE